MPVRGPALVHDLGGEHRIEIERLLAHREKDVALPALHVGSIGGDEPQAGRARDAGAEGRAACAWRRGGRGRGVQGVVARAKRVVAALRRHGRVLGIALAAQRLIEIDVLLERERGIEHLFHGVEAVGLDVALDLAGVCRGMFDDLCVALILAASKLHVVLGEIGVPEHVCGHQHVVGKAVARGEIGVARDRRETPPRTGGNSPCAAAGAGRCSARRRTSAACAPAARRRRSRS